MWRHRRVVPKQVSWYRLGRNDNDANNQWRCQDDTLAIERNWKTGCWKTKQLACYVALSVSNAFGCWTKHLVNTGINAITFRKLVAEELMGWCAADVAQDEGMVQFVKDLFNGPTDTSTANLGSTPYASVPTPAAPTAATATAALPLAIPSAARLPLLVTLRSRLAAPCTPWL